MPRFSANLAMLFRKRPFLERLGAARAAGFEAVEMPFPDAAPREDLERARDAAGVEIVEFDIPAGDVLEGATATPPFQDTRRASARRSRRAARGRSASACRRLNVLAGHRAPWLERGPALEALARSLGYAAERLAGDGITVLLEAVNRREQPTYLIATTDEALEAMALAGHDNIRLEHDLYHLQIMEGDLTHRLERVCDRIGHIQFADSPGRH